MTSWAAEPTDRQLELAAAVAAALRSSLAPNTWRAYAADWRHWSACAGKHEVPAMPAESLDRPATSSTRRAPLGSGR